MTKNQIKSLVGAVAAGTLLFANVAGAQATGPNLMVGVAVPPTITPGARNTIALISLDASRSTANVRIPSLTVSGSFTGGVGPTVLKNCSIAFANAASVALNTGANAVSTFGTTTTFTFDTPVLVPAGGVTRLALICDVDGAAPRNATITVGITPSTVPATDPATAVIIVPTALLSSSGTPLTSGIAIITPLATTTPHAPNTGTGGSAGTNYAVLVLSGLTGILGARFLVRSRRA